MKKIGLFYGPEGGSVDRIARRLAEIIGKENVDLHPIKGATAQDLEQYDSLILGISTLGMETWKSDHSADDWDKFLPQFDKMNYKGKTFALYGLGDHISYALHFVDALGALGEILLKHDAKIIGQVPAEDYEFQESKGVIDGRFIGLPLDEEFESEKTEGRIRNWLNIILPAFD